MGQYVAVSQNNAISAKNAPLTSREGRLLTPVRPWPSDGSPSASKLAALPCSDVCPHVSRNFTCMLILRLACSRAKYDAQMYFGTCDDDR
eukprot:640387-Pleurochrysis_carterae.AAC.2